MDTGSFPPSFLLQKHATTSPPPEKAPIERVVFTSSSLNQT